MNQKERIRASVAAVLHVYREEIEALANKLVTEAIDLSTCPDLDSVDCEEVNSQVRNALATHFETN